MLIRNPLARAAVLLPLFLVLSGFNVRLLKGQTLSEELARTSLSELADEAAEKGNAVNGAILFAEQRLGCANCHATGSQDLLGPDLSQLAPETTNAALVESLLEPSKVIREEFRTMTMQLVDGNTLTGRVLAQTPNSITLRDTTPRRRRVTISLADIEEKGFDDVSAMPRGIVDELRNRQEFLDVVRYLIELRDAHAAGSAVSPSLGGQTIEPQLRSLALLDDLNCRACHDIDHWRQTTGDLIPAKQAPLLAGVGARVDPAYLRRFIASPHQTKPGTAMPDLLGQLSEAERTRMAEDITHYLVSLADEPFTREATDEARAGNGRELFHTVGCVACHSPRDAQGSESLATQSVALGDVGAKYSVASLTKFLEDPHAVRPSGRMPQLPLSHFEALDIAHYLVGDQASDSAVNFVVDEQAAEQGRGHFIRQGCAACHSLSLTDERPPIATHPLGNTEAGCLSAEAGPWPRYDLSALERQSLTALLRADPRELSAQQQVEFSLSVFRCVACHQRGELGGVPLERDEYFQTTDANLGPQGRIPPPLTGVGGKLNPNWLRQVLVSGRSIRPYMQTRMPLFGVDNIEHLLDLMPKVDARPARSFPELADEKTAREAGHQLVGNQGLNCVACHTYQLNPSATMSAVDLTEMHERLQRDWFYDYMRAPQQLSPNTVMPSFWPGGRAIRADLLEGDADRQLEALWVYLSEGRQARQPRGLVNEPLELLATHEAVMLRRSYPGVGKRGIGVGYPTQVNLVFDAEQMRLAMLWQGGFADPGGVWRSQGHGTVRPLARNILQFPNGPELDYSDHPWVADEGRPPHHQFKGYRLDEQRRPRLRYQFEDVSVEDYPTDLVSPEHDKPALMRTLTLTTDQPRDDLAFRVATGKQIVDQGGGRFIIDGSLEIQIAEPHQGTISTVGEESRLHIPLRLPEGETVLILKYLW